MEVFQGGARIAQARGELSRALNGAGCATAFVAMVMKPEPGTAKIILRDASDRELFRNTYDFTPAVEYPNGERCPPRAVVAGLHVTTSGATGPADL